MKNFLFSNQIIYFSTLESTNDLALSFIAEGKTEPCVIYAGYQSKGRGQLNATWHTKAGENVTASFLCFPTALLATDLPVWSMASAVAVLEFLHQKGLPDLAIKWANDIYVGEQKIAGMLLESKIVQNKVRGLVLGVGLNVNSQKFDNLNACSMAMLMQKEYAIAQIVQELAENVQKWFEIAQTKPAQIKPLYMQWLFRRNIFAQYLLAEDDFQKPYILKITDVNKQGELCTIDEKGKERTHEIKTIKFLL